MQAETLRQALVKLDELEALMNGEPEAFRQLYYDFYQPAKRMRKALEDELYYTELDLDGLLVKVLK